MLSIDHVRVISCHRVVLVSNCAEVAEQDQMDEREDLDEEDLYPLSHAPSLQSSEGHLLLSSIEKADVKDREHDALEESCANK